MPQHSVCTILVVDDNRDNTDSMAVLLLMMGHEVHRAYDGATAIDIANEYLPDIVLLDLAMPGPDGFTGSGDRFVEPRWLSRRGCGGGRRRWSRGGPPSWPR